MHSAQLIRLFEALADEQLALLYGGRFPDAHTAELITLGEEALGGPGTEKALRSRTGFVMVEAYQNVLRHAIPVQPEEAAALGRLKADDLASTGATIAVSANIGCSLQIRRHLDEAERPLPVEHPMQLLARSAGLGD